MKSLYSSIIICAMLASANQVLAINYQNTNIVMPQNQEISDSQYSAAKLLQDYVEEYKMKINNLYSQYNGNNPIVMSSFNQQLSKMSQNLYDIQEDRITSNQAWKILSEIVSDLKTINTRMKVFLEQEKILWEEKLRKKQQTLAKIWSQISKTLDSLLLSISNQLLSQSKLSAKEKRLVESLVVLRAQNNKMKNFSNITFETETQMKEYLKQIVDAIRNEFIVIRNI